MIDYTLTRSKRKTVAIYVRNGEIEIRAPLRMPKRDINKFIMSKEEWITDKLAQSSARQMKRDNFTLSYGDTILYRGKNYTISAKEGKRSALMTLYFLCRRIWIRSK